MEIQESKADVMPVTDPRQTQQGRGAHSDQCRPVEFLNNAASERLKGTKMLLLGVVVVVAVC
jgi:hypothetical protein